MSRRIDTRLRDAHSLIERDEYEAAWPSVSDALNERPDDALGLYLAACILRKRRDTGVALQLFRRSLALNNSHPNVWMHYGACLHDTHQYEDAREAFQVVATKDPEDPMPLANIAATYTQEGRAREAIEWADKALAIDPNHRIAHVARGMSCLALKRWREGWKSVKHIYGEQVVIRVYRGEDNEEPEWDGTHGQTVVVQCEQGLGDIIMYGQCLREMVRDCRKVIIDCNPRLEGLFRRSFPECDVYGTMKQKVFDWPRNYTIDARIHISYLGKFYRNDDRDFKRQAYLVPHEGARLKWRYYLMQFPRPWVGVMWKGGIAPTNAVARSVDLESLAPVLDQQATFISLEHHEVGHEIAQWNLPATHRQVYAPPIDNDNIDDLTALIAELDHVVTVTATVAHICGALGKRAYVLVPRVPAWRYGQGGDSMLWYPENSVRLYRQANGEEDFGPAINRLAKDFEAFVVPLAKAV